VVVTTGADREPDPVAHTARIDADLARIDAAHESDSNAHAARIDADPDA
jgi:hypothetical protein